MIEINVNAIKGEGNFENIQRFPTIFFNNLNN